MAVALAEGAELGRGAEPLLLRYGNDVDHARDRVRPVERRGARLKHFDPVDHVRGDGVEIDRRGNAAGAGAVDEPEAVDQHQGALGAEVAKVDFGRAGADAAAVGRVADVARIVDLRIEPARGARQALQHVGDRRQAGLVDVGLVDIDDRRIEVERVAANARAGDDDLALVGGRGRGRRCGRLRHVGRRQRALRRGGTRHRQCKQGRTGFQNRRTAHGYSPISVCAPADPSGDNALSEGGKATLTVHRATLIPQVRHKCN